MGDHHHLRLPVMVRKSALGFGILAALLAPMMALAQVTPFGVPGARAPMAPQPAGGIAAFFLEQQAAFQKAMTQAISLVATSNSAFLTLLGIAFAYGFIHAIGPGHGKAVIASYLVANESQLKRGVLLSFMAAGVQALVALGIVVIIAIIRGGSATEMERVGSWIEALGFGLIALIGLRIAITKIRAAMNPAMPATCDPDCGHDHAALSPGQSWRDLTITAIGAGIRPCSGAIILLVFALAKGLFLAGALAVAAMAVGTALGTSLFALLAVKMKHLALSLASGRAGAWSRLRLWLEAAAGLLLAAFGILLATGMMAGGS